LSIATTVVDAPLLQLRDVTVRFGGLVAVDGVSFAVNSGEICALIGPNGAGKTTLFNAVSGNVVADSGSILFCGEEIRQLTPHEISARGARRTFQNGGLFPDLTALENVLVGLHAQVASSFVGLLFGRTSSAAEAVATTRARDLLELMGVGATADQKAGALSGGQLRMVEIVRALATNPPLLLLDEPAVGLAPQARQQLATVIRTLAHERGIGILLIEHAIELVMSVADRVIVLNDGRKVADAPPEQVRADRAVLEAYLGHA
jgi:branched-chain amino acid transport system ATP-binding protein